MKTFKVFHRPKLKAAREGAESFSTIVQAKNVIDARNKSRDELYQKYQDDPCRNVDPDYFKVASEPGDIIEIESSDYSQIDTCEIVEIEDNHLHDEEVIQPEETGCLHYVEDKADEAEDEINFDDFSFDDIEFDDLDIYHTVESVNEIINNLGAGESHVIYDLDDDTYHAADGYSSSNLKLIAKSPALFKWMQESKQHKEPDSFVFGKAFHCAVLEPERYQVEYAIAPNVEHLKPAERKNAFEEFQLNNSAKYGLENKTGQLILDMHQSLFSHESAKKILINPSAKSEVSIFWRCPETNLVFKIRCDAIAKVGGKDVIFDLKTSHDINGLLKWNIKSYGYDFQAYFYSCIYEKAFGVTPEFVLCIVSKTLLSGRYETRIGRLRESSLSHGKQVFETALSNIINYSNDLHLEEF